MRRTARPPVMTEVCLGIAMLITILPIAWLVLLSFQSNKALVQADWTLIATTSNYADLFGSNSVFAAQLLNSLLIVIGTVAICLGVGGLTAYSLSRLEWSSKTVAIGLSLAAMLTILPPMALVPGLYGVLSQYGLYGTIVGLILLDSLFNLPFTILLLKVYFDRIPPELRDAARVDGANEWRTLLSVMLPLATPGLASAGIYVGIMAWNEFLFALTMTSGGASAPITVGIAALVQPTQIVWGQMAAAGVITAIPIIIIAILFSRRIVAGLTAGAVKG